MAGAGRERPDPCQHPGRTRRVGREPERRLRVDAVGGPLRRTGAAGRNDAGGLAPVEGRPGRTAGADVDRPGAADRTRSPSRTTARCPGGANAVPFAREALHFAVSGARDRRDRRSPLWPQAIAAARRTKNLAGEPLDDLVFEGDASAGDRRRCRRASTSSDFMLMGCVVRSLQIAGALAGHAHAQRHLLAGAHGLREEDFEVPGRAAQPRKARGRNGGRHRRRRLGRRHAVERTGAERRCHLP